MITLDRLQIGLPDNGIPTEGWTWARVSLMLKDEDTDERPSVEVSCHIQFDESKSIAEAKQDARENALRVLQAAIDLLK